MKHARPVGTRQVLEGPRHLAVNYGRQRMWRRIFSVPLIALLVLALMLTFPVPVQADASPGWIVSCSLSHQSQDDPILYPGRPGVAHLHEFVGALSTNAHSTPASLRAGGTNCAIKGDSSAYWTPAMYENGQLVAMSYGNDRDALFYYRRKGIQDGEKVSTIPDGLRIIIGNMHAKSPQENRGIASGNIIFKCGPGSTEDLPHPPSNCPNDDNIVVSLRFPNCWDGRNLDSSDHFSHMAYPDGNDCPSSHPVVIPRMESFFRYEVGPGEIGEISFSSGPWWTIHQDFFNAWDQGTLQGLINECINRGQDCGKNPQLAPAPVTPTQLTTPPVTTSPVTAPPTTPSTTMHQHPSPTVAPPTTMASTTTIVTPTTIQPSPTTVPAPAEPERPRVENIIQRLLAAAASGEDYRLTPLEVKVLADFLVPAG